MIPWWCTAWIAWPVLRIIERPLIRERQREGIALAKQRGAYRGRKKALVDDQVTELRRRASAGEQKAMLAREFGIVAKTSINT